MEIEDIQGLVLDCGTEMSKAGFTGDDTPRAVFPSSIDTHKDKGFLKDETCQAIERGVIVNFDEMEKLWAHSFHSELRVSPEQHPLLMAESPLNPKYTREKTIQVLFETFNFPALYLMMNPMLSLYSSGKTTGLVVESGAGVTHTVPIYEGYPIPYCIRSMPYGGKDLTEYLSKLLATRSDYVPEKQFLDDIKQKLCFVTLDAKKEMEAAGPSLEKNYEMPDGQNLILSTERFLCPEAMFEPLDHSLQGIHLCAYRSIMKSDADIRKELYSNILLCGGNSSFPGFSARMVKEMTLIGGVSSKVKVTAPQERMFSVWIGGSILAALGAFQQMWITRQEYEEAGPTIVHRKCF